MLHWLMHSFNINKRFMEHEIHHNPRNSVPGYNRYISYKKRIFHYKQDSVFAESKQHLILSYQFLVDFVTVFFNILQKKYYSVHNVIKTKIYHFIQLYIHILIAVIENISNIELRTSRFSFSLKYLRVNIYTIIIKINWF